MLIFHQITMDFWGKRPFIQTSDMKWIETTLKYCILTLILSLFGNFSHIIIVTPSDDLVYMCNVSYHVIMFPCLQIVNIVLHGINGPKPIDDSLSRNVKLKCKIRKICLITEQQLWYQ